MKHNRTVTDRLGGRKRRGCAAHAQSVRDISALPSTLETTQRKERVARPRRVHEYLNRVVGQSFQSKSTFQREITQCFDSSPLDYDSDATVWKEATLA